MSEAIDAVPARANRTAPTRSATSRVAADSRSAGVPPCAAARAETTRRNPAANSAFTASDSRARSLPKAGIGQPKPGFSNLLRVHAKGKSSSLGVSQPFDDFAHRAWQLVDVRICGEPPFRQQDRRGKRGEGQVGGSEPISDQVLTAIRQEAAHLGKDVAHVREGAFRPV